MSRCGIVSSAETLIRPLMSFPSAKLSGDAESRNSSDSRICRRLITSRFEFGTSIPTVGLPGIRSIRIDSACRPRQRSSLSVVMREYFTPASGLNSNVVTTGPGLICVTDPCTLNSSNFDLIRPAMSFNSWLSYAVRAGGSCSSSVEGSRNSLRCLGGWKSRRSCSTGTAAGGISIGAGGCGSISSVWIGISSSSGVGSNGGRSSSGSTIGGISAAALAAAALAAFSFPGFASTFASIFGSAFSAIALLSSRFSARAFAARARFSRHDAQPEESFAKSDRPHAIGPRNHTGTRDISNVETR